MILDRGQQILSVKRQIVNLVDTASHLVSVANAQFGHCSSKATTVTAVSQLLCGSSNKTSLTKTGGGPDFTYRLYLAKKKTTDD